MSRQREACVLASGGVDSTACIVYYLDLGFIVRPIFVDFGNPANAVERQHVRQVARHYELSLREIELQGVNARQVGEIRGRNAAFVTVALMANPGLTGVIALGIHAGSPYYDTTQRFRNHMSALLSEYTNGEVQFDAPFLSVEKPGIVEFGKAHELPFDLTYSCETGATPSCGKCPSCKDREVLGI